MRFSLLAVASAIVLAAVQPASAMSRSASGYTLVLVPDQYGAVQITHDLSQHYPVVMASYEHPGDAANPNIHVFQGGQWLHIANANFTSGGFLKVRPARTIVVGDDDPLTNALLTSARAWNGQQVLNIPFNNGTDLINWYGKYFNFGKAEWKWFSQKYKLTLRDESEGRRQESWYERPYRDETRVDGFNEANPAPVAAPRSNPIPVPPAVRPAQPRSASLNAKPVTVPAAPAPAAPALTPAKPWIKPVDPAAAPAAPAPVIRPVAPAPVDPAPSAPVAPAPAPAVEAPAAPVVPADGKPAFQGWVKPEAAPAPAPAK